MFIICLLSICSTRFSQPIHRNILQKQIFWKWLMVYFLPSSLLASLHLSPTFDTIDHNILLHRRQNDFGHSDTVLEWFHDVFLLESNCLHLCHFLYIAVYRKNRWWVRLNDIRSSVIHTVTNHNSITLLLLVGSLTWGFTSMIEQGGWLITK